MKKLILLGLFVLWIAQTAAAETWELVFSEDFSSPEALKHWQLEGAAAVSVTPEGRLLIETQKKEIEGHLVRCSVLWYSRPIKGDLRFEFDARGDMNNRCIFFFNAQPREGHKSIFEWERPLAPYEAYSNDERIQLYSFGILRHDQEKVNLRHLGNQESIATWNKRQATPNNEENAEELRRLWDMFQDQTVISESPSPFGDEKTTYHFDIRVVGNRLVGRVNGKRVFDLVDEPRGKNPLRGGYVGFRNFRPTRAWHDNIRIYRRKP